MSKTLCIIKSHVLGKPWVVTREKPREEDVEEPEEGYEVEMETVTLSTDMGESIVDRFKEAGFTISSQKRLILSKEKAHTLFTYDATTCIASIARIVEDITSSAVIALVLEREGAVEEAISIAGDVDPILAKVAASGDVTTWPLRAQFGEDVIKNGVHVSSSEFAANYELNVLFPSIQKYQRTFAMITPDAYEKTESIIGAFEGDDFIVIGRKEVTLTKEAAADFCGDKTKDHLLDHLISAPVTVLALEKMNAVGELIRFVGPTVDAPTLASKSLRGQFSSSGSCHANVVIVASSEEDSAKKLLQFFPKSFPVERTFAMIKPGTADKYANEILTEISSHGFTVIAQRRIVITSERASEFYKEHKGKVFFEPLVEYMTSGPTCVLVLSKASAIKSWRTLCGPTNSFVARKKKPNSLRAKFGLDGRHNAVHGADSTASATREISFHFPRLHVQDLSVTKAKAYIEEKSAFMEDQETPKSLNEVLVEGLTELCRAKPAGLDATRWLGKWLLENNPNKPGFTHKVVDEELSEESKAIELPNNGVALSDTPEQETKVIFVLGGPGSGKGTQCEKICKEFGYTHISTGDLLRSEVASGSKRGEEIKNIISSGGIVPQQVALTLLKIAIKKSENNKFLVDGYPRELAQAFSFEQQVSPCTFVLYFDAPDAMLSQRCLIRGKTSGRSDDNEEAIKRRLKVYHQCSKPVIDFYSKLAKVKTVDASLSVDEVYFKTRQFFLPEVVFFPSAPGSGTSTLCEKLAVEFKYTHLSIGTILKREVKRGSREGVLIEKLQKEGRLVPVSLTIKLLKKALIASAGTKFLLDGFPRTNEQALAYEKEIGPCKFMLSLEAPIEVMKARCVSRGRSDDTENAIRQRLSNYKTKTEPVVATYKASRLCRTVDGSVGAGVVYSEARKHFLPRVVFVLGGPGSGKGSQCAKISEEFGYTHLSAGDLLRAELARGSADGIMIDQIIRAGKIVPVEVTLELLRTAMIESGNDKFLVDGFPRAEDQAEAFEKQLTECSMVLFIDVPESVLETRLLERGRSSGRSDDNIEAIKKRLKVYHMQSMPVIDMYSRRGLVRRVDGNIGDSDAVYNVVRQLFMNQVVFVLGGPGAGKGTMCAQIVETYGYNHLSTGDLLRAEVARKSTIGVEVEHMMKEGKIVPQEIIMKLMLAAMANTNGTKFLLDGFPRSVEQAKAYEKVLGLPSAILYLDLSEDEMKNRLLNRGLTSGRADDNEETIVKRFQSFKNISFPVLGYYKEINSSLIKKISAAPEPKVVFDSLRSIFNPELVLVSGCTGTGRGTLATNLGKNLGFTRLRMTQLLEQASGDDTPTGDTIRDAIRNKRTVPIELTINIIKRAILESGNSRFILDGFPRVVSAGYPLAHDQVVALEESIAPVKAVLHLDATEETRVVRSGGDLDAVKEASEVFGREKLPIVRYFESLNRAVTIDANGTIENVYESALKAIE